jgi:hypothetical protein
MSIILSDEQCLQWIKDPSISPYVKKYWYTIEGDERFFNRISKKQILTNEMNWNPNIFINRVKDICFMNSLLRQKIVDKINEYERDKTPRLSTLTDKWKYDSKEMKNPDFADTDYETYFTEEECERFVKKYFINPRTNKSIKQNSRIYIELLYTTMQYGINIDSFIADLHKETTKKSGKISNENTLNIINGITKRLKFMKENDKYFLSHNIKSFDKLLDVNAVPSSKKPKSKNTFDVSSYSSSSVKSLTPNEKILLRDKILLKEQREKKEYEYSRQKKLQKKLDKIALSPDVDKEVFTKFKRLILTLDKGLDPVIDSILRGLSKEDNEGFMVFIKENYEMANENITITDIVRGFIFNIYKQIIKDPKYRVSSEFACFSYTNKSINEFDNFPIINKIRDILDIYIISYQYHLGTDIIDYYKNLIEDIIPTEYVFVLHTYRNGNGRDARTKISFNRKEEFFNQYYKILYENSKIIDNRIQYRLPEGYGFLNGKNLMRKIAALDISYFNKNIAVKVIVPDDNDLNDFTYEECRNWVMMPIINPRTFERIRIDAPIYNRLLCMTYQYDCNLIPRMITSRGYRIINALKDALKKILEAKGKPSQTREQLESYLIDKQLLKKKGNQISEFAPEVVGLKWKDYGVRKPKNGIAITANSEALVSAFEKKIRRERIASRSSQDPVAFYVFFTKKEWDAFKITNITKDSYIKVKAHYYIPVVAKKEDPSKMYIKSSFVRTKQYIAKKPYSIIDCLKWVMQPYKNPVSGVPIAPDSPEYYQIFKSALLFDSNIQPIDITARGLIFKKNILREKKKHLGIVSVKAAKAAKAAKYANSKGKNPNELSVEERMADIINNSEICSSINNIYTDNDTDEKYVDFKKKMLDICFKYLGKKENCDLAGIKREIFNQFVKDNQNQVKGFIYYEGSALASIIVYHSGLEEQKLYDKDIQNNYINLYKNIFKVYIQEIEEEEGELYVVDKPALDYGGVSREFFTKLFEELFCDEENTKRPFIIPEKNSISNRYYINPNFEPDENFRKVIEYYTKNINTNMSKYDTEKDYINIYKIIGRMLGITIVNEEIGLPKQFSSYILSRFINSKKELKYYDILYYYLRDFNNSVAYMNMMNEQQKGNIDLCDFTFNSYYVISRPSESNPDGRALTKENYTKYILQLANHAVTKNFLLDGIEGSKKSMNKRYNALFAGFNEELRGFFKKNNITIDILDKLITHEQLNEKMLIEFAKNMKISVIKFVGDHIDAPRNNIIDLTEEEKEEKIAELRIYLTNIITKKREEEVPIEKHYEFIKRLLQFWSGFSYYNRRADVEENGYKFFYMYGANASRFPTAHTCFYQLDFFGFPDNITAEERETYLYDILYEAVFSAGGMELR